MDSVELKKDAKQDARVPFLYFKRWLSAAAAVVLVCGSGILYYILHHPKRGASGYAINHHQQTSPDAGRRLPDGLRKEGATGQTELSQTRTDQTKESGEVKNPNNR